MKETIASKFVSKIRSALYPNRMAGEAYAEAVSVSEAHDKYEYTLLTFKDGSSLSIDSYCNCRETRV